MTIATPRATRLGMLLALLVLPLASLPGATPPQPPESFEIEAIDRWLRLESTRAGRVGMSVAIALDGKPVLTRGYGVADLKRSQVVTPETRFAIGSISKQFTCAIVLLLAEDGLLSLQDPVSKYYPTLTRSSDITLVDLMNHVSGYPDYYPLDFLDRRLREVITPDDLLQRYAGGPLDFDPGTRFSYSNTGFILLARIAERVTRRPFGELLQQRIFGPLGMHHTRYEPAPNEAGMATGYATFALGDPEPVPPESAGWLGGAGGIVSTPSDLLKWDLSLADGRIFQPGSFKTFTAPRTLRNGKVSEYGCGIGIRLREGRPVLTHSGAVSGFNAYNAIIPSTRSALAITCNVEGGLGDLPEPLLGLLLKEPSAVPQINGPPAREMARTLFLALQKGRIDRLSLGVEFNLFLTDQKLSATAARLRRYGRPTKVELDSLRERGGMEVSVVRLHFKSGTLKTLMYRQPDGTVEQFFVDRS